MNLPYPELLAQLSSHYEANPIGLTFTGSKVGIEPIFDKDISEGGIIIPELAKGRCTQGIVKFIGRDCTDWLRIGDYVLFAGYDGDLIRLEDSLTIVLPEDAISAKIIVLPEAYQTHIPAGLEKLLDARTKGDL
jgi:co-chaperonin GroES (HSP10)